MKLKKIKEQIEIAIDSFNGQDYTDLEVWEDMEKPLKEHIKEVVTNGGSE